MTHAPEHDKAPFGQRFAEAWTLLQAYLADLDAEEMARIAKTDLTGTLDVLKRQPALGQSQALTQAGGKSPEALALAIIEERLGVLTGQLSSGPEGTFGGRFLHRWREVGGALSSFSYSQIQKLKSADRDEVVKMFRARMGTFQIAQVLKTSTPEAAAETILNRYGCGSLGMAAILL